MCVDGAAGGQLGEASSSEFKGDMLGLAPKWVRLAPNGRHLGLFRTNQGLFQILKSPKCVLFWGQSDPLWSQPCTFWLTEQKSTETAL